MAEDGEESWGIAAPATEAGIEVFAVTYAFDIYNFFQVEIRIQADVVAVNEVPASEGLVVEGIGVSFENNGVVKREVVIGVEPMENDA